MTDPKYYLWRLYDPITNMWVGSMGAWTPYERRAKVFTYAGAQRVASECVHAVVFRKVER